MSLNRFGIDLSLLTGGSYTTSPPTEGGGGVTPGGTFALVTEEPSSFLITESGDTLITEG